MDLGWTDMFVFTIWFCGIICRAEILSDVTVNRYFLNGACTNVLTNPQLKFSITRLYMGRAVA